MSVWPCLPVDKSMTMVGARQCRSDKRLRRKCDLGAVLAEIHSVLWHCLLSCRFALHLGNPMQLCAASRFLCAGLEPRPGFYPALRKTTHGSIELYFRMRWLLSRRGLEVFSVTLQVFLPNLQGAARSSTGMSCRLKLGP